MTKKCARCGEAKPVDRFYNLKSSADGKMRHCKDCHRDYQKPKAERKHAGAAKRTKRTKVDAKPTKATRTETPPKAKPETARKPVRGRGRASVNAEQLSADAAAKHDAAVIRDVAARMAARPKVDGVMRCEVRCGEWSASS